MIKLLAIIEAGIVIVQCGNLLLRNFYRRFQINLLPEKAVLNNCQHNKKDNCSNNGNCYWQISAMTQYNDYCDTSNKINQF